jgi:ABC-type dipeptide/oligopeptide/nickel transport system permease subunit
MRLLLRQIVPNLRPVLLAQFLTSIPVFILAEANLGMLGLSAGEPYPTWGNLLQELQSPSALRPEVFAPLTMVALCVCCFKLVFPMEVSRV